MKRNAGADAVPEGRLLAFCAPTPYNGLRIGSE